jgi:alpha-1,3/alpha-1,6-mannosyltransferase
LSGKGEKDITPAEEIAQRRLPEHPMGNDTTIQQDKPLRIALIQPELGPGGSERFVLDAALELKARGHLPAIFTTRFEPALCLEETWGRGLDIRVCPGSFSTGSGQGWRRVRAMALVSAMRRGLRNPDVVVCDAHPAAALAARWLTKAAVIQYYRHPGKERSFTASPPATLGDRLDHRLEQISLARAHCILAESHLAVQTFSKTFPDFRGAPPQTLYPGVDPSAYREQDGMADMPEDPVEAGRIVVLCLDSYTPASNLEEAVEALAVVLKAAPPRLADRLLLVLAGRYDSRDPEQRNTLTGLRDRAQALGVVDRVLFYFSLPAGARTALLHRALCVVSPGATGHFDPGVLDAMAAGRPVVATASGGTAEAVADGETGVLCEPAPDALAQAIMRLAGDARLAERLGSAGRARVEQEYSRSLFGERLDAMVRQAAERCEIR